MAKRRVVIAAVALAVAIALVAVVVVPPARAIADGSDPCGAEPNWWDFWNWSTWEGCEIANGNAAAPLTEITSPLLGDINDGITGLTGAVNNLPGAIASALGGGLGGLGSAFSAAIGGVITFLTPQAGDFQPVVDALQQAQTHQPFTFIAQVIASVQATDAQWTSIGGQYGTTRITVSSPAAATHQKISIPASPSSAAHGGIPGKLGPKGQIGTAFDFGPLSAGVADWLWFMQQIGMPQSLVATLFDVFMVMTTAWSILADLGVRTGAIEPGSATTDELKQGFTNIVRRGRTYHQGPSRLSSRKWH